ncbi:MAG TPA: hypothetical protein VFI23_08430 [Rhizomicrobium sp.]|nr:hypothetical protein [Rhizomicrobium sp.]
MSPAAAALALDGASRQEADAFLRDQRALIAAQLHHLHEQLKQIHLDIFEKWLGALLRLATLCVGIGAVVAISLMVRDARNSNGLLIEPFKVPPDLAAKGLSGETVASRVLDRLSQMQNGTQSGRPAQSYSNNWGNDLKVEVPETGVSVGELRRLLREWLGHDTHITGEVWHTPNGVAIAARAGGDVGEVVTGQEADFENLLQQVAENVYRATQPYRYANYLDRDALRPGAVLRVDEAEAIYRRLIYDPDPVERAWAWNGLANLAWTQQRDIPEAVRDWHKAHSIIPDFPSGFTGLSVFEMILGHAEAALTMAEQYEGITGGRNRYVAEYLGDYAELTRICMASSEIPDSRGPGAGRAGFQQCAATGLAGQHDGAGLREWLRTYPQAAGYSTGRAMSARVQPNYYFLLEDWRAVIAFTPRVESLIRTAAPGFDLRTVSQREFAPRVARAKAMLGDIAGAQALIAATPADCYDCIRARAVIAALAGEPGRADYWFTRAVRDAPSLPFAYHDWGRSLLARGQPDAAIAQFMIANKKGPHFADALEGWGEALMAKNQSHLALTKFADAEKYAPNWGRLHLKWGEAITYAGKKNEAQKQFARAALLDLTPSEKSELARQ